MREQVFAVVQTVIAELNEELEYAELGNVSDDTILYDGGDGIDSLSLVRLIVSLEERCDEQFGKRLTLADEKAMSLRHSPYRTAGSLTEFIVARLQSDE